MRTARNERGSVLPLVAAGLVFAMGMTAFGVDLGWFYLNASRQQTAADAAALAAVVAMPPDSAVWESTTAYATAVDVGGSSGYAPGEITPKQVFLPDGTRIDNRVQVEVRRNVRTFFLKIFGRDSVTIRRSATAEFIPPLQLGSDSSVLGTFPANRPVCDEFGEPAGACLNPEDPTTWGGTNTGYWLAINAQYTAKEQGDSYMTRCLNSASNTQCQSANNQFEPDGYYYAVDVPAGASGLSVSAFDARYWGGATTAEVAAGDVAWFADGGPTTTYRLYEPDLTPANPTDNNVLACGATSLAPDQNGFLPGDPSNFRSYGICSPATTRPGIYVLQVTAASGHSVNGFSIRASTASGPSPAVYGIGRMSIKANQAGTNPRFRLVKVTPAYAGKRITVGLFDPGESAGDAYVFFEGPKVSGLSCQLEITRETGAQQGPYSPNGVPWDGGPPGGAPACWVQTAPALSGFATGDVAEYNGDWIDFHFDVPSDYTCDVTGSECWWDVRYVFGGASVHDRTTWRASVQGQPIRLVLETP